VVGTRWSNAGQRGRSQLRQVDDVLRLGDYIMNDLEIEHRLALGLTGVHQLGSR